MFWEPPLTTSIKVPTWGGTQLRDKSCFRSEEETMSWLPALTSTLILLGPHTAAAVGPYAVSSGRIAYVPGLIEGEPYSAEIFYPTAALDVAANASSASVAHSQGTALAGEKANSTLPGASLWPITVFAHGTGGGYLTTYQTNMKTLASYGFIVLAPMSCPLKECYSSYSYDQLATAVSARNMGASLHPALAYADFTKVGVYGHSMGAMATMLSAAYASKYNIVAAAAQHPCVDEGTIPGSIQVPIMYTSATGDSICAHTFADNFYAATPGRKVLWELQGSSHFEPCDGQGQLRECEPVARFLACEIRGESCDLVYGSDGQAICNAAGLAKCLVSGSKQ